MGQDNGNEADKVLHHLESLLAEIKAQDNGKGFGEQLEQLDAAQAMLRTDSAPDPDEKLRMMELALRRTRGTRSWTIRLDWLAWRLVAPFWDLRLRAQLRLVRELARTVGWSSSSTADAIRGLDDLVFARTYGRRVEAPIKSLVRQLADNRLLATHELRNLVCNRCFRLDAAGRVSVPRVRWQVPAAVVAFILATLTMLPLLTSVIWSNAEIWRIVVGTWAIALPYWFVCWQIQTYFLRPFRLIPRVEGLIPRLQRVF